YDKPCFQNEFERHTRIDEYPDDDGCHDHPCTEVGEQYKARTGTDECQRVNVVLNLHFGKRYLLVIYIRHIDDDKHFEKFLRLQTERTELDPVSLPVDHITEKQGVKEQQPDDDNRRQLEFFLFDNFTGHEVAHEENDGKSKSDENCLPYVKVFRRRNIIIICRHGHT